MGTDGAFRAVLRDRTLRRLQYAVLGSMLGRFGFIVALGVWAYGEGGAGLVGVAGFLRLAPAAVVAPFAGSIVDRHRRDRVMAASDLSRAVVLALAAVAVAIDAPVAVVLALVAVISVLGAVFEPARAAIMPSLVDQPELLTAANAVSSAVNSCAYFLGPALGGFLLVVSSVEVVFAATAATLVWSATFVLLLRPRTQMLSGAEGERPAGLLAEVRDGVQAVAQDPGVAWVVGLLGLQTLIAGAVSVFVVVVALEKLDAAQSWVGILDAAAGVGALIGVAVVSRLLKDGRLSTGALGGLVLWGVPLLLIAAVDSRLAALMAMVVIGIGDTAIDVSAITLLQRVVPESVLGRVFGLYEAIGVAGLALGALLAPALIALLGLDGALVVFGCLPIAGLLGARTLRALDARAEVPAHERARLRAIPMFHVLPLPALDRLAGLLDPVTVAGGDAVFRQGDAGDRFYVVDAGEVEVLVDGDHVRTLGPGEAFGEIALLRDVPRTATVRAVEPTTLLALDRQEFLAAVTGHAGTARAADGLVRAQLARRAPAAAVVA